MVWHGTTVQGELLATACARNCDCKYDSEGHLANLCKLHNDLSKDQRWLDGLLFVRWLAERLLEEEYLIE